MFDPSDLWWILTCKVGRSRYLISNPTTHDKMARQQSSKLQPLHQTFDSDPFLKSFLLWFSWLQVFPTPQEQMRKPRWRSRLKPTCSPFAPIRIQWIQWTPPIQTPFRFANVYSHSNSPKKFCPTHAIPCVSNLGDSPGFANETVAVIHWGCDRNVA